MECLLIDDDQDDQEIFQMAMEKTGLKINCSFRSDPVEALQMLSDISYRPYCIFVDMNMPKLSGLECLESIRTREHLNNSLVIMYSTSADHLIIRKCKDLGADEFLVKVPSLNLLAASLSIIFNRSSDGSRRNI
jgi:PleD family two-component response regulator